MTRRARPTTTAQPAFGRRLRALRAGRPMAAVAGLAGVTASYWSRIERGRVNVPPVDLVEAFAAALHTEPATLLGWDMVCASCGCRATAPTGRVGAPDPVDTR